MPVMEAMSVGVPVVATNCGAMPELLGEGRGFLMDTEYSMIDPWGNSRRDFPSAESGKFILNNIHLLDVGKVVDNARAYMETRTWDKPTLQVKNAIEELLNEKQEQ